MLKYSFEKTIPSCNVEKKLLQELEYYVLGKVQEIYGEDITKDYKFIVKDFFGEMELKNVDDFKLSYFPDDTKAQEIIFLNLSPTFFYVSIRFGMHAYNSYLKIELQDEKAHEKVKAMYSELIDIFKGYKNNNFIFHLHDSNNFFVSSLFGLFAYFLFCLLIGGTLFLKMGQAKVGIFSICFSSLLPFYIISARLKPYSVFSTRINSTFSRWYNWFFTGFLAFIVFNITL